MILHQGYMPEYLLSNCVKKKMSIPGKTRRITFYFYWRLSNESLDPGFGITISGKTGAATGIE